MRDDHDNGVSNTSDNTPFTKILDSRISRRKVVVGSLATAATTFIAGPQSALAGNWKQNSQHHKKIKWKKNRCAKIDFTPVPVAEGNGPTPTLSEDYEYDVLIPWGEPLQPGGPAFNYPPSSADQALQVGIGHDGMTFFPFRRGKFGRPSNKHGLLAINHEYGGNGHVLGKDYPESLEDVRVSQHAHGVGIVELKEKRPTMANCQQHLRPSHPRQHTS